MQAIRLNDIIAMLFQKNIVKKYVGLLNEELIAKAWGQYQIYFLNEDIQNTVPVPLCTYPKSQMGFGVIKEYLKKYPKTPISELKSIFHIGLLGSWGRWNLIEDDLEAANSQKDVDNKYRHLVKEQFVLTSGDNVKFVVCNKIIRFPSSTILQHEFPKTQILYTMYNQTNSWNHLFSPSLTNTRANAWNARCHQGNGNIVVRRLVRLSKLRASAPS